MKLICPACGQTATRVRAAFGDESAAYCENCGWNAGLAAKKLRSSISTSWLVIIFGVLLSAFVRHRAGLSAALALGCAFILFPLSSGLLTRGRVLKVERVRDQFAAPTASIPLTKSFEGSKATAETLYQQRPRRTRFNWGGWIYSLSVLAASILLILLVRLILRDKSQPLWSGKGVFVLASFACYFWLCASFFVNRWKERRLLVEGDFARGIVLIQEDVSRSLPRITYAFRDSLGRQFQRRVTDFSHSLFEQMPVSIFYDQTEPSHSTALESSLFRLLD